MVHLLLFLEACNDGLDRCCVLVEFILGQVNPADVLHFVLQFLANRHAGLLQVVLTQVNFGQGLNVENRKDFFIVIVREVAVAKGQSSQARHDVNGLEKVLDARASGIQVPTHVDL